MKTYLIERSGTFVEAFEVEAETEEKAKEAISNEEIYPSKVNIDYMEITEVS